MLQKSKARASISDFRADPARIRRLANMLPIKGLLYAISHAIGDPEVKAASRDDATKRRVSGLSKHMPKLYLLASGYNDERDDPSELLSTITSATRSYVNLFYAMQGHHRLAYIERHSKSIGRRVKPESNLLMMPAIMAQNRERRSQAYSSIIKGLYSMPARFLYTKSNAALKVELLQQGMGLKGAKDSALSRLSFSMGQIQALIGRIANGDINPENDEMAKALFVNEIVAVSEAEGMSMAEFLSDRLSNGSISFRTALRMVRK
ncbi:MAG: hypothetical protein M1160_03010 [Candidatus Marsarchaeota archaeon]|nr:hypothetical protein [Candidatus Marsarchaeota archaeon]MCL5111822.1 hypothetical protein [Candidatus Marsarchaeota archaeon]